MLGTTIKMSMLFQVTRTETIKHMDGMPKCAQTRHLGYIRPIPLHSNVKKDQGCMEICIFTLIRFYIIPTSLDTFLQAIPKYTFNILIC